MRVQLYKVRLTRNGYRMGSGGRHYYGHTPGLPLWEAMDESGECLHFRERTREDAKRACLSFMPNAKFYR